MRMTHLLRNLSQGAQRLLVAPSVPVQQGQILAVSRGGEEWCAAVGTPRGTFLRGGCLPRAYRRGEAYSSRRREPTAPHEYEALRWGVGEMVKLATGKARDLSFWEAPGLLYEGFWGKGYLVLYWKCGEADFLEVWTPKEFFRLRREEDPDSWWKLYETLLRNSYPMKGFLHEPRIAYQELLPILPVGFSRSEG
jgi:hypothetical protein